MAVVKRIVKLANPHRAKNTRKRMSASQVKFFGTKRQKSALRTTRSKKRNSRKTGVRNPAYLITLGAANPHKENKMAKRRKRNTAHKSRTRRRVSRNPRRSTRIVVAARTRRRRKASNPRRKVYAARRRAANPHRSSRRRNTRRNPVEVFGHGGVKNLGTIILGGLLGVTATKFIPTLIPANLIPQSNIVRVVVSAGAAYAAGKIGEKFGGPVFGNAVMFGGLMQAASVALNTFLPSAGARIGLSGMRELVPGQFIVPQNPLRQSLPPAAPAVRTNMNGLQRVYGHAY